VHQAVGMSGRVISGYRNGKPIRGFRKTQRFVVKRLGKCVLDEWTGRFIIPDRIGFALALGRVDGFVSSEIVKIGRYILAEVVGKNRAWVCRQADALAEALGHDDRPLYVALKRNQQPFMFSGPFGRGDDGVVEIERGGIIIDGSAMRTIGR
jgi:hypothetical protein